MPQNSDTHDTDAECHDLRGCTDKVPRLARTPGPTSGRNAHQECSGCLRSKATPPRTQCLAHSLAPRNVLPTKSLPATTHLLPSHTNFDHMRSSGGSNCKQQCFGKRFEHPEPPARNRAVRGGFDLRILGGRATTETTPEAHKGAFSVRFSSKASFCPSSLGLGLDWRPEEPKFSVVCPTRKGHDCLSVIEPA